MGHILKKSWALLLGLFLLMLGNGMQGTLLSIRGAIEGFSPTTMSYVMAAYYLGFLLGSRLAPLLIRRVGHVRVFAALASLVSAAFIAYAMAPDPLIWAVLRLVVGFGFSGVYVVAESWLNDAATNETRGQALSAYMIVQMAGLVVAQFLIRAWFRYVRFVIPRESVQMRFLPGHRLRDMVSTVCVGDQTCASLFCRETGLIHDGYWIASMKVGVYDVGKALMK